MSSVVPVILEWQLRCLLYHYVGFITFCIRYCSANMCIFLFEYRCAKDESVAFYEAPAASQRFSFGGICISIRQSHGKTLTILVKSVVPCARMPEHTWDDLTWTNLYRSQVSVDSIKALQYYCFIVSQTFPVFFSQQKRLCNFRVWTNVTSTSSQFEQPFNLAKTLQRSGT